MTVAELIERLMACDPQALVVINDEPILDITGKMMLVDSVERGWTYPDMTCDLTFSMLPVGDYLVPAVRLLGVNDKPTPPDFAPTINGTSPMKEVRPHRPKRLP